MEREELRLGEALKEERSWESDGITVLTASVELPQLAGKSGGARRFNRYYRGLCRAYLAYCGLLLLPAAADSCRAALAVSAPWSIARAELRWRPSLQSDTLLSVVCDIRETIHGLPPFLLRRSEVWDLRVGLPIPLSECFPEHTRCKKTLLRFAREETLRRMERGAAFRENWRAALRRNLNTRSYYLTEEGLCFYYPLCSVADAKEAIVTFTMALHPENGPFLPLAD